MAGMYCINDLLELVLREGAKELRLQADQAPAIVLRTETLAIDVPVTTNDDVTGLFETIATKEQLSELHRCGDIHFIYVFQNSARFAVTARIQRERLDVQFTNLGR